MMRFRIACAAFLPLVASALPNGMQWEVRPNGSNNNAAFYDDGVVTGCAGGTDRSKQDAAFVAFNGSTVTATTVGVEATITITGYTVVSTDVCNGVNITGGTNFIVGRRKIISVNTGANTWTFDANVTTGAGSAMTGNMGGGAQTVDLPIGLWANGNDTVWIQNASAYTVTSALQPISAAATGSNGNRIRGYNATHGDSGVATITSATNGIQLWNLNAAIGFTVFENLILSHTAGTRGDCVRASTTQRNVTFNNVTFDGCQIGINGDGSTGDFYHLIVNRSEFKNMVSDAISARCGEEIKNSYFHDNAGAGYKVKGCTDGILHLSLGNVFYNNLYGFWMANSTNQDSFALLGNDFASNTSDNIRFTESGDVPISMDYENNINYGAGGYGWNITASATSLLNFTCTSNAWGANITNNTNHVLLTGCSGNITGISDPWIGRTSGNFALSAAGKLALAGLGFPGAIPNAGTGYLDIGALQVQAPSGVCSSSCVQ